MCIYIFAVYVYANMHLFASCFVTVAQRKIQVAHAACLLLLG